MIIQRPGQKILTIGNPGLQIISPRGGAAWTPANISGLKLWIDFSDADTLFTDAGSTPVSSDGDAIYQANDKSGNGNHVLQATSAYRPSYKVNIKNSLSVSRYDTNKYLEAILTDFVANQPITTFVVGYENAVINTAAYNPIWSFGEPITPTRKVAGFCLETTSADSIRLYGGYTSYANTTYQTWYSWAHRYNGDGQAFDGWLNGDALSVTASAIGNLDISSGSFKVGRLRSEHFYGDIAELAFCFGAVSDEDIALMFTYLNNKWNIY